ncbi:hypothetical protein [Alkalibacillus almallahensis]|uniref:hypothetical protein n=1 Tax=Alkalibacillus almallahensis TaxID=1379154 RepID=UPI00141FE5FE|nr:hypothetical protein [Alkalibacillus almallahensis]NIK11180.1 hypothetical protein [Alkalibacillus almallahensis]
MSLYSFAKDAAKVAKDAGNIELYSQILEIQERALELQSENEILKKEIEELKDKAQIENSLYIKGHFYYREMHGEIYGPYCTVCWDNNNKLIRAHVRTNLHGRNIAHCHVCNFSSTYLG